ncbi:MAG: hypothetical protein KDK30_06915 [Leptospiraceae bacterium]|nr:hypothetical protein [Leptospiraceae bacterium]
MNATIERTLNSYGGRDFWTNAKTINAIASVTGLAFKMKHRPFFERVQIQMDIHQPVSRITPIGRTPGISGILNQHDVRLENEAGETIAERADARRFFPYGRRLFYWDDLDMAYFANYAFWNYFTFPALLMRPDIHWQESVPGKLAANFPDTVPTHSRRQEFYIDAETGLLKQHNYAANVISKLAYAANVVHEHAQADGIPYVARRIVTPQGFSGKPLRGPVLIDIRVHALRIY